MKLYLWSTLTHLPHLWTLLLSALMSVLWLFRHEPSSRSLISVVTNPSRRAKRPLRAPNAISCATRSGKSDGDTNLRGCVYGGKYLCFDKPVLVCSHVRFHMWMLRTVYMRAICAFGGWPPQQYIPVKWLYIDLEQVWPAIWVDDKIITTPQHTFAFHCLRIVRGMIIMTADTARRGKVASGGCVYMGHCIVDSGNSDWLEDSIWYKCLQF